jgi:dethiobiotin synthase
MLQGVFVTGTDTGVGKTVVSAALLHRYRATGALCYWKPVQTGIEQDDDTAVVRILGNCAEAECRAPGFCFRGAVAPYLAARRSGVRISVEDIEVLARSNSSGRSWVVEGAGGVLVPLNESELVIDLMQRLALPVVVVARTSLGTINHTLLTLESLRSRSIEIAGVVLSGEPHAENRSAIEHYGRIAVLGELPPFSPLTSERLQTWAGGELDRGSLLTRHFQ